MHIVWGNIQSETNVVEDLELEHWSYLILCVLILFLHGFVVNAPLVEENKWARSLAGRLVGVPRA